MCTRNTGWLAVASLLLPCSVAHSDERPAAEYTFDHDEPGKLSTAWKVDYTNPDPGKAEWVVVADSAAPSPKHVLKLAKAESADATYNLVIADKPEVADVDVSVKLRPDSGQVDQGGGLVWRCKDARNYYICRINPLEGNFRVYRVVDGKRTQLQSVLLETKSGRWYSLRATMVGDRITCSVDGKPYLQVNDDTLTEAGRIGLWTKADAATSFDDLIVRAAGSPQSQPASDADQP
jgi:hypothetical protein